MKKWPINDSTYRKWNKERRTLHFWYYTLTEDSFYLLREMIYELGWDSIDEFVFCVLDIEQRTEENELELLRLYRYICLELFEEVLVWVSSPT